jgi:hypothetical protein
VWLLLVSGGALAIGSLLWIAGVHRAIIGSLALATLGVATLLFAFAHEWGGFESGGLTCIFAGLGGVFLFGLGVLVLIVSVLRVDSPKHRKPPPGGGSNDL